MEKYRTLWRRLFARIIDSLVLKPLGWIDLWVVSYISGLSLFVWWTALSFVGVAYYVLLHGKYGQTIGKMVCKVKVLDISETKLSYRQAVLRDIVYILILMPLYIYVGYQTAFSGADTKSFSDIPASTFFFMVVFGWTILDISTMLFNDKCRAMHDYIAGSVVVKTSSNSLRANSQTHGESVESPIDFSTTGINRVQPTDDDDAYMGQLEKIAAVENEIEAICLTDELEELGIPYMMQSYHDSAYDGLFQSSLGWGHVEAPIERKDEILEILDAIRQRSSQP